MRVRENKPPQFFGPFAAYLYAFIAHKQALGYKYYTVAENLTMFDAFSISNGTNGDSLSKELVDKWVEKRPAEKPQTQIGRISAVREFSKYLDSIGVSAYSPPMGTGARVQRYIPYIFTRSEISRLFAATDNQRVFRQYPQSHMIAPAILRLLYGTGIRISEALALQKTDVNFNMKVIKVVDSKFGKDRLVPLSDSLAKYLAYYVDTVKPINMLFPNRKGGRLTVNGMYAMFRRILWESGISHGGRGNGPRLHDLRHTFSAHSIAQMVEQGIDLYVALPILAAYLGHEKLSTTNQYVRLTAESFPDIINVVEEKCGFVFPRIGADNEE
jgi:site-specific recombinase XerD